MPPWLTDSEIADLCQGLTQPAAMVRYLRDVLGLEVRTKPNGRPLVIRSHAEAVLSGRKPEPGAAAPAVQGPSPAPNRAALLQVIGGRRGTSSPIESVQSA